MNSVYVRVRLSDTLRPRFDVFKISQTRIDGLTAEHKDGFWKRISWVQRTLTLQRLDQKKLQLPVIKTRRAKISDPWESRAKE